MSKMVFKAKNFGVLEQEHGYISCVQVQQVKEVYSGIISRGEPNGFTSTMWISNASPLNHTF